MCVVIFLFKLIQTMAVLVKTSFQSINASIIQGLGLGHVAYIYNSSDLHQVYLNNIFLRYADDIYLIVPVAMVVICLSHSASSFRYHAVGITQCIVQVHLRQLILIKIIMDSMLLFLFSHFCTSAVVCIIEF